MPEVVDLDDGLLLHLEVPAVVETDRVMHKEEEIQLTVQTDSEVVAADVQSTQMVLATAVTEVPV